MSVNLNTTNHTKMIKIVFVGDGGVGKTCLCTSYAKKKFPEDYVPTVFESWAESVRIGEETWTWGLWDTAGQDDYDRLRPLSYPQADIFVVCFNIASRASFDNVQEKWFPEIRHYEPDVPSIVVGLQIDLRFDVKTIQKMAKQGQLPISAAEGEQRARHAGAIKYVECSAKTREGLESVFDQVIAAAVTNIKLKESNRPRKCIIL
ncbi:P-loop containing nucleoside triphosphate hydrolase protein [Mycena olivaceomarginata]|nr:P-loop containing nucleoside triphosphate hydrolase protein [Mycena olivaceomarginata]